jgi:streptogramin lyase
MRTAHRCEQNWMRLPLGFAVFVALGLGVTIYIAAPLVAQQSSPPTGTVEGAVTADDGEVRALRVRATDTVGRILYTVYTRKGRYRILHLPPGRYDVEVVEEAFASPRLAVDVRAGVTQIVDIALTARQRDGSPAPGLELTSFDQLYAPAPALDLMRSNGCFECHWGPPYRRFIHHMMGPKSESQWRRAVERMFDPQARLNGVQVGAHVASIERISPEQKESIIRYLSTQFGPDYKRRDLALDPLVRDEDALANALYVQYELKRELGPPFEDGTKPGPTLHSIGVSERAGVLWLSGVSSSNMVRVDTRDPNFETRTREWRNAPYKENTRPHGVFERAGRVWWAEVGSDRVGEMDTEGSSVRGHALPTAGAAPHDVWPDSKGNLWVSYWSAAGKVGRIDTATGRITESETIKGASGYGIVVDRRDRVWVVGLNVPFVQMRDPQSERWKQYAISSPARRVSVDSSGKVWVNQYFGNAISMVDPDSGKVTEYRLPLKHGNPYDVWPDRDDNLWIENSVYNALVRFDQKTRAFTYFPFPDLNAHTYKFVSDAAGTIWFGLGSPTKLTAFKVNGNAPLIRRQSQSR